MEAGESEGAFVVGVHDGVVVPTVTEADGVADLVQYYTLRTDVAREHAHWK